MKSEPKSSSRPGLARRSFLKTVLIAGASAPLAPELIFAQAGKVAPNERVNIACIGIGNRPADVIAEFSKTGLANKKQAAFTSVYLQQLPAPAQKQ